MWKLPSEGKELQDLFLQKLVIVLVLVAGHSAGEERSPAESSAAGMGLPLHPNSSLKTNWSSILGACSETWFYVDLSTLIDFVLLL